MILQAKRPDSCSIIPEPAEAEQGKDWYDNIVAVIMDFQISSVHNQT
jgi:hypothetical protein